MTAAQLLLTLEDTEDRRRYLNARATISTLLGLGCVPVINENDSVATAEIRFGDNDRLAARVAEMVQADQLVLLSDIDGLYTADPKRDPDAAHIGVVPALTPEIEAMGGEPPPGYSSGGMRTKLVAARIATQAGCAMAIALGHQRPAARSARRGRALHLVPARAGRPLRPQALDRGQPAAARQRSPWMRARRARSRPGARCCRQACRAVEGAFERGDPVLVHGPDGAPLARGLTAYASADARRIAGHHSEEIEAILGWRGRDEIIHRDDLVLLSS